MAIFSCISGAAQGLWRPILDPGRRTDGSHLPAIGHFVLGLVAPGHVPWRR
jgi:hypothetical protein